MGRRRAHLERWGAAAGHTKGAQGSCRAHGEREGQCSAHTGRPGGGWGTAEHTQGVGGSCRAHGERWGTAVGHMESAGGRLQGAPPPPPRSGTDFLEVPNKIFRPK